MNRIYKYFALLFCTAAVWACAEEMEGPTADDGKGESMEYREARVSLDLSVAPAEAGYGVETKAETYPKKTKKFWFIQYDAADCLVFGPLLYDFSDAAENEVVVLLPNKGSGEVFTGVFLSATDETAVAGDWFTDKDISTMEKLYSLSYEMAAEDICKVWTTEPEDPNLMLFGDVKIDEDTCDPGTAALKCTLRRNVAKLNFTVRNNNIDPNFVIESISLRNVPKEYRYYVSDTKEPTEYVNHEVSLTGGSLAVGQEQSFTLYIPQNLKEPLSTPAAAIEQDKNKYAPNNATYLGIRGCCSGDIFYTALCYFLGSNMTDNFEVEANHVYNVDIDIKTLSSWADSRIERNSKVNIFLEESNCYIINPAVISKKRYAIPMTWMYQYWTAYASQTTAFTAGEELVAEVIWQDQGSRLIRFCDEFGTNLLDTPVFNIDPSAPESSYIYFKTDEEIFGNVLIGIKRKADADKSDAYLWSWHLWITDYSPDDRKTGWDDGQYIYAVKGGEVHRYQDYNSEVWATTFKDKYIMDRNLGAMSADPDDGLARTGGLYYSYGRNNPYPNHNNLFSCDGQSLSYKIQTESGPITIDKAINTPNVFRVCKEENWDMEERYMDRHWKNPKSKLAEKSIFDPCPEGWMVPPSCDIWNIFAQGASNANGGRNFMIGTEAWHTAYYPLPGYISTEGSGLTKHGSVGYHRVGIISTNYSTTMYFSKGNFLLNSSNYFASGFSVRCIQE